MKKNFLYILIVVGIFIFLAFFFFKNTLLNTKNNENISATRLSTDLNINDNSVKHEPEQEIASFSTDIKDNSEGRLINIYITCSALDNTIISPNETFSFNDIVGKPSTDKGYEEATVIINGKHEEGIGGGNCQVSSTLYNAVLQVPFLEIVERNEHGLPVTYVPEGQDAAVSYGSLDLKFKNNSDKRIRINISNNDEAITAKITQL